MNSRHKNLCQSCLAASVAAVLLFAGSLHARAQVAPPPIPAGEEPEVLTRGPVHEAFAEPVILQSQVSPVAPVQPPENIDEVPPTERPAGDQYAWVPGYWSWDGERNNYIWISACWRAVPPNMSWVPGYWSPAAGGWEWVAGFWTPAGSQEIEYVPAPPANDAVEPPGPPPAVDSTWVPPCWYWSADQYVQRPGYWLAPQPDWVWVASHYIWTPRGYIFAGGHWDYPLENRGVLFAPVSIAPAVYSRPGYAYSPTVVVDLDLMSASLFVSPSYDHYYYGDYYDDASIQVGIFPWFDSDRMPDYYDPIYEYDRSRASRSDPQWDQQVRHDYDDRRANVALRPPRTFQDMETRVAQAPAADRSRLLVVQPLSAVVKNSATITNNNRAPAGNPVARGAVRSAPAVTFENMTPAARTRIATQAAGEKKLGNDRKGWEAAAVNPKAVPAPRKPLPAVDSASASRGPAPTAGHSPPAAAVPLTPTPGAPSAVRNEPATPRAGRNPAEIPPTAAKEPVAVPVPDHTPPTAGEPAPQPRRAAATPPREVPVARPERVKIPSPSASAEAAPAHAADKGPPPKPADEERGRSEAKSPPARDDAAQPGDAGARGEGNRRGN